MIYEEPRHAIYAFQEQRFYTKLVFTNVEKQQFDYIREQLRPVLSKMGRKYPNLNHCYITNHKRTETLDQI